MGEPAGIQGPGVERKVLAMRVVQWDGQPACWHVARHVWRQAISGCSPQACGTAQQLTLKPLRSGTT